MKPKYYKDAINECMIKFLSNASQDLINSLEFNGEWHIVKTILLDRGYKIIEAYHN